MSKTNVYLIYSILLIKNTKYSLVILTLKYLAYLHRKKCLATLLDARIRGT